jgi:hypothetical protein
MFNSLLLDSNDSVIADRLSRLQDSLRSLTLSTREDYQAAVYSLVNTVLNLGDNMQTLIQVRSKPAIVGDLTQNLTLLNQDSNDIAAEILRIENSAGDLYNLAAASQNALRQLIRQSIYISNQQQFIAPRLSITTPGLQPFRWVSRRRCRQPLRLVLPAREAPSTTSATCPRQRSVHPSSGPDPPWNCFCLFPAPRE